ncbi:MAG TPA: diaminopimelate epimerase [Flavipsychrobacter sp.]|nr:diaminopimelate epimerase [Flavipsychrobacter sp.]
MQINFYKYQGTGNDFILIDNREKKLSFSETQIAFLCNRHFGIGADGLMLLELEDGYDFKMVYYNSDGNESTMCGNGGRCITAFAQQLGVIENEATFLAIDGSHHATINAAGLVCLEMTDVNQIDRKDDHVILNTGSPHYICWVEEVDSIDVFESGRAIRSREQFQPKGINVNFVQRLQDSIRVRTYERGVEDETLSCGTGVTAASIAFSENKTGSFSVPIETPGGKLEVSFDKNTEDAAINVVLKGPALFVFEGTINL